MTLTNRVRSSRAVRHSIVAAAVGAVAVSTASSAPAQQPAPSGSAGATVSGSVIDASTAAPLARATVTLTTADGFAFLVDPRTQSPSALARTVTTSANGTYRFSDLPIGAYRLRVQRVGYEPATIEVRLGDSGTSPVSVGLVVLPVRLRPVEIRAHDPGLTNDRTPGASAGDGRIAAALARQEAFLSTDVRELTTADVAESATLGGSDVLRSLQRLPGVTQLDDWSAKLWVRGNRWDHDRVYYDGLPLFDPLGVLGRTSGVSADAIGGAFLHPGVRSVLVGGEGATRIDLRSRPSLGTGGDWRGSTELSQFGVSGAVERSMVDSSAGFALTAQHSLGRWLRGLSSDALSGRAYSDAQATFRGDADLGNGKRFETSGLVTSDARTYGTDLGGASSQTWSNAAGRITFFAPLGTLGMSQSVGITRFASSSARTLEVSAGGLVSSPVRSSVDYATLSGRIETRASTRDVTTVGYDVTVDGSSIDGTQQELMWPDSSLTHVSRRNRLRYGSAWVDTRTSLGERVTLETGLRADVGGATGVEAVRPAGSAQALFALSPGTRVSLGAGRVHQYVQGLDLPVVGQNQTLPTSWLTSGDGVPVMSVDNAMAGVEQWFGRGVLAAANLYARHTSGAISADPTPGSLLRRPLFVDATESAQGVELSARMLVGRATGLLAYSYGKATMSARGLSFPAPADRTHALDAAVSLHLNGFNLSSAYTLTSGAPYTRIVVTSPLTSPGGAQTAVREAPNAQRLPAYSSLDLSLDYTRVVGGFGVVAFAGAQNVLGRRNATWYEISGYCENGQTQPVVSPQCRDHDLLGAPVKLTPTIGLRLIMR
jgi:hypothetical protein